MSDGLPSDKIGFNLTESAEDYLSKTLPDWTKEASARGLVPILSYSGGGRCEKDGQITWEYQGPFFLLADQRHGALGNGKYFDLLGFPVWIGEVEQLLLKGRLLTFVKVGGPEPEGHLVIDNVPENFFETALKQGAGCCSCRSPDVEGRV
jgi:hypothetical protein